MTHHQGIRRAAILSAVAVTAVVACGPLLAQDRTPTAATSVPKCTVQPDIARFTYPLPRLSVRLSGGLPIKIVAIGSSSTSGAGASVPANAYPSRLEAELRA